MDGLGQTLYIRNPQVPGNVLARKIPKKFKKTKRGDNSKKCVQSKKNNTRDGRIWTYLIYSESSGSWERPRKK